MSGAGDSGATSGWFIAGIVALVVGVACFVALFWWLRKRRAASGQSQEPALSAVWKRAVAAMPASERSGPVLVVLGERLSGKSTLVRGALGGCDRYTTGESRDLDVYAGAGQRVQEISGDLLLDPRKEPEAALRKLWKDVALQAPRVVLVVNARSLAWNDAGLRDLGRLARRKIDLLAALRGSPVRVRVAVTHLDEQAAGFVPLCQVLQDTGERGPIAYGDMASAAAAWKRVAPRGASTRDLPAVVDFVATESRAATDGASVLRSLSPLFETLLAPTRDAPAVDGVFLCAAPAEQPFRSTGDALADDEELDRRDEGTRRARFIRRALLAAAAIALVGAVAFAFQRRAVDDTERAVAVMETAVKNGTPVTRTTEARAAEEILEMQRAGVLFGNRRADLEERYAAAVRDSKLLPALRSTDRASRIRALSVLNAGPNDELREAVLKDKDAFASALGVLPETLDAYLAVSDGTGPSDDDLAKLAPLAQAAKGASTDDWSAFFQRLSNVLGGQRLDDKTLTGLQGDARDLARALDDAGSQAELSDLVRLLEARHPKLKGTFGTGSAGNAGSWMLENASTLRPLLKMVLGASLDGPSGDGKGLREAVSDLRVLTVPPVFVAEEPAAPATSATASAKPSFLDRLKGLAVPAASALPSALPSAVASAVPSGVAAPSASSSASAAPSASASSSASGSSGQAAEQAKAPPVYQVTLDPKQWTFDSAVWSKAIVAGRSIRYLTALFADSTRRSVLFPRSGTEAQRVLPSAGRGPSRGIDAQYTHEAFVADVSPGLSGFETALDPTGLSRSERDPYVYKAQKAAEEYGKGLHAELESYYGSFQISSGSAAALAADVADSVSPASFFTDFLKRTADEATMPSAPSNLLRPVADSVADYGPVVRLMQGDNGKYPALEPYYKLLIALIPSLVDKAPPSPPSTAPLDARLAPIGTLAYSAMKDPAKSPSAQIDAWLNDAAIPEAQRRPFRLFVQRALGLGKADIERAAADAWTRDLKPVVSPLLTRFPFSSRADIDAHATDVDAMFNPKGTFPTTFASLLGPVCREGPPGVFTPLEVPTAGTVQLPAGALRLASWASRLQRLLFGADGKPQAIQIQVKAPPLSPLERERTITFAFLIAGNSSFYAFNQAPSWQSLPVAWYPGDSGPGRASVGIQTMVTGGGEPRIQTLDAPTSDFAFFRLLQRAEAESAGANVTWEFPPEETGGAKRFASFLFQPPPTRLLEAPSLD